VKLNLGCGLKAKEGWVNADIADLPGVDCVMDMNKPWLWSVGTFERVEAIHVFEHAFDKMFCLEELWRVMKHGAIAVIETPNFQGNPDAWMDPTHRNAWHPGTMDFFHPTHPNAYYTKARFIIVDYLHSDLYLHWKVAAYKRCDAELLAKHQDTGNWREKWIQANM